MENNICIYIHWPWCKNICYYCDFYKFKICRDLNYQEIIKCYIRDLKILEKYTLNKTIISLYIGGGSPSVIKKVLLQNLIEYIFKNYKLSNKLEFSIEVNPEDINKKKLKEYRNLGVNRICIGIQSFSNDELKLLGRKYTKNHAVNSILKSSDYFDNIGIDLIFGIPKSNRENFEKQLYFSRELPVKHISLYEFDFANKKKSSFLIDSNFFEKKKRILEEKKFFHYETTSYSKAGYQSCYNNSVLGMKNYIGIGPSAHGRVREDNTVIRIRNTKNLKYWLDPNENTYKQEILSKEKKIEELLMLGLNKSDGVSIKELAEAADNNISKYINLKNINDLKKNNFLFHKKGRLFLNSKGMLVINNIVSKIVI